MSTGLLALLDDIGAIVKVTAASLDDIATQTGNAGTSAIGVVIDDAAVTPKYVVGLSPKRELPIIWNIAKGSLKNKILFLIPAALILGGLAPWAIQPILAFGGVYLCLEGYEKIHHVLHKMRHKEAHLEAHAATETMPTITPDELEKQRTSGAIRTDFILSAEIVAISYAVVTDTHIVMQAVVLIIIAVGITLGVYGTVALIVKADDLGAHMARHGKSDIIKKLGLNIIKAMPAFLKILGTIGTAAMLWVGGGIVIHSVPVLHHSMEHLSHSLHLEGGLKWLFEATLSGVFGCFIGAAAAKIYGFASQFIPSRSKEKS